MSLTKKRTLTEKRIAANQANGRRSHGPVTVKGRERIRNANLRHGFTRRTGTRRSALWAKTPRNSPPC